MTISAIVVDDEPLARQRLSRLLVEQKVSVVGEAENGEQAIEVVKERRADVIFLDINMPRMNGLEAAKVIVDDFEQPPAIVFCTAYDQHALDAFKVNASAYLLKPVSAADLNEVLEHAAKVNRLQNNSRVTASTLPRRETVTVASQGDLEHIALEDISYFRAIEKYVYASVRGRGEILVGYTLKQLQDEYQDYVIRTHRSVLVVIENFRKIERAARGATVVHVNHSDVQLPVSRRHLSRVKQCFLAQKK